MKTFVLNSGGKEGGGSGEGRTFSIAYKELLNPSQFRAVMHDAGHCLVIAGAGTGKTRTLIYRVARLIESGVRPQQILLLTFTRRAASEMLRRASGVLDERCSSVRGGTFHSHCSEILRTHGSAIGIPSTFTIADADDAQEILQMLRARVDVRSLEERFPTKQTLSRIYSAMVNRQWSLQDAIQKTAPPFLRHLELIEGIFRDYVEFKLSHSILDFDDLLIQTSRLFRERPDILQDIASRNRHVMIDEYQDTNALQAELSERLASVHGNLMVVGDDAQGIYSFRGADHRNILRFEDRNPGSVRITLEENYRSTRQVLNLANDLMGLAHEKIDKKLTSHRGEGELPGLVRTGSIHDQSRFVAQMILRLREEGEELGSIGVLFRNGRDSYDLELELKRMDLPFVKWGGQKFTDAAHIKDVLAHLRILQNPMDALAWSRVLHLIEGVGDRTAEELFRWVRQGGDPREIAGSVKVAGAVRKALEALASMLRSAGRAAQQEQEESQGAVRETLRIVIDHYASICAKRFDDYPKRLQDLEQFIEISGMYRSLRHLLEETALDPIEATAVETLPSSRDEAPLVLSTIHSAKGMEWRTVFVIQCIDGIIPSGYSVDDPEKLDEELRLLYVAVTRAKDRLFVTYPVLMEGRHEDVLSNPSRFLKEASQDLLEPWMLVEGGSEGGA